MINVQPVTKYLHECRLSGKVKKKEEPWDFVKTSELDG
jgi:hypothetical protein